MSPVDRPTITQVRDGRTTAVPAPKVTPLWVTLFGKRRALMDAGTSNPNDGAR